MSIDYSRLQTTATDLITKFGQAVTFTRDTRSNYNPSTGNFGSTTMGQTIATKLVLINRPKQERSENTQQFNEQEALVSSSTALKINDRAAINGSNYRVTSVKTVQPASTVIYYELLLAS